MGKYGYARVSTKGQGTKGNSLEDQVEKLEGKDCTVIFKESYTGTTMDRPEFKKLLSALKPGDTLTVTKLDRLARSARDAMDIIRMLFDKGVAVHILNMGMVEDSTTGRLIFNILASFAEFERDMIVERTQEGKAIAKQREDFREGRPKVHGNKKIGHALSLLSTHTYKEVVDMTGISESTLRRAKRKQEAEAV